ncbi:hypothetical protein ACFCW6_18885 [Streptomyces sp. NPDC056333]|uniref:hypothetical protein n=1 Tax=Streptomyces sp. NPDC056333 TaxID=3345786 RepID=UPI0035DC5422
MSDTLGMHLYAAPTHAVQFPCRLTSSRARLPSIEVQGRPLQYGPTSYVDAVTYAGPAREVGASPAAVALAWVQGHPGITSTLVGARRIDQFEASCHADSRTAAVRLSGPLDG